MKILKPWPQKLVGILILALACQMILLGAVLAQEDSGKSRHLRQDPKKVNTESANLRIIGKRPEMIVTQHMNFRVVEGTAVVNSKGKSMDLADLPVPCNAKIFYQSGRLNDRKVWQIVYKGKLKGARTTWSTPRG